jgi:hypothetical protein
MRSAQQYVIEPPSLPNFIFKHFADRVAILLIEWANKEFYARLKYCAEREYYKELKWLNDNSSPIKILAEMREYRKICSYFNMENWNRMSAKDRRFIRKAFELREALLRKQILEF